MRVSYHQKYPPEGVPYAVAKAAGTLKESPIWWAKYYVNGRPVRVSTGTEKQQEAERFLADRTGRVATGQPILPRADRVRYDELVLALQRRHLDLEAGTLRLDPGTTKNDEGRIVYLPPALKSSLAAQVARVGALEKKLGRIIPDLFPHLGGAHKGTPIRNFRKAWASACKAAGVLGRTRHDLRRTAVRNLVNAGVVERVAMTVTGHRTRRVFDAYHIVSPADLQDVARKLAGPPATAATGSIAR